MARLKGRRDTAQRQAPARAVPFHPPRRVSGSAKTPGGTGQMLQSAVPLYSVVAAPMAHASLAAAHGLGGAFQDSATFVVASRLQWL